MTRVVGLAPRRPHGPVSAMHLFAYGTLMFPEIWRRVVGRQFDARRAALAGYAVYRVRGDLFPVMVRGAAEDSVQGVVYFDLDDAALRALDEYESDLYERLEVAVRLDDGRTLDCQAYVLPEAHRRWASEVRWDAEWFRGAMDDYLRRTLA